MARKPRTPRTPRSLSLETTVSQPDSVVSIEEEKELRDSVPTADLSAEGDIFISQNEVLDYGEPVHEVVRDMFAASSASPDAAETEEKDSLLVRVTKRRKKKQGDSVDEISALRQEHRASRRRSWRLRIVVGVLILCLIAGAIYAALFSPLFSLSLAEVTISSPEDSTIDEGDIRTSLVAYEGISILRLSPSDVARHIEDEVVGTDNVIVRRNVPHGLSISYSLKEPYACLFSGGTCTPIDEMGRRIPETATTNIDSLIRISYRGKTEDIANAVELVRSVLDTLDDGTRHSISRCDIDRHSNIQLVLNDGRVVVWGQARDNQEKAEILSVLLSEPGTFYDISVPSAPIKR